MTRSEQWRLTGWAIQSARRLQRMSRADFARELEQRTERPWNPRKVTELETGRKAPTVDIIRAASKIQGQPINWYFPDTKDLGVLLSYESHAQNSRLAA